MISLICSVVSRGGKNPCVVLLMSNAEEGSGVGVPIPTCAMETQERLIKKNEDV